MAAFIGAALRGVAGMTRGVAGSKGIRSAVRSAMGSARRYGGSAVHKQGMRWVKDGYGLGKGMGTFGRTLGVGFMAFEAYAGYQREGVWGAAKGVAEGAAWSYGMGAVLGSAALPAMAGAAVIGGGLVLNKAMAEKGLNYGKSQRNLEMGGGVNDQFGTVSTMRRRSVIALQTSRIGGNMSLGNEAMRQYQPYFR